MLKVGRRGFISGLGALGITLLMPQVRKEANAADSVIYLTFDDGAVGTQAKAMALNALGVLGTFFITGQMIDWHTNEVQFAVNSGHRLANHTWDHKNLRTLSYDGIQDEIVQCEKVALRKIGVSTAPLLHAPFFADNATVRAAAGQVGFTSIQTNWDTNDWAGSSAAYIAARIRPGVVTMHTQGPNTVAALESVVPGLLAQGYTFGVLG